MRDSSQLFFACILAVAFAGIFGASGSLFFTITIIVIAFLLLGAAVIRRFEGN